MIIQKGDILDRTSILMLKVAHQPGVLSDMRNELIDLLEEFDLSKIEIFVSLLEVNSKIWELESDIRRGQEGTLGLEEVGRRALAIRDLNKERIFLKNSISKYKEVKVDHISQ